MKPMVTPQIGTEIPLLELQHAEVPARPACIPRHLARSDVQGLVADAFPALDQAHEVHDGQKELVHIYRDRNTGACVVVSEPIETTPYGTVREVGNEPLWDRLVDLLGAWNAAGRPEDYRSLRCEKE